MKKELIGVGSANTLSNKFLKGVSKDRPYRNVSLLLLFATELCFSTMNGSLESQGHLYGGNVIRDPDVLLPLSTTSLPFLSWSPNSLSLGSLERVRYKRGLFLTTKGISDPESDPKLCFQASINTRMSCLAFTRLYQCNQRLKIITLVNFEWFNILKSSEMVLTFKYLIRSLARSSQEIWIFLCLVILTSGN